MKDTGIIGCDGDCEHCEYGWNNGEDSENEDDDEWGWDAEDCEDEDEWGCEEDCEDSCGKEE